MRALLGIGVLAVVGCTAAPEPEPSKAVPSRAEASATPVAQRADQAAGPSSQAPADNATPKAEASADPVQPSGDGAEGLPPPPAAESEDKKDGAPAAVGERLEPTEGETAPVTPTVAETAVRPTLAQRPWREVVSPDEPITLIATTRGILGRGKDGYYDVDENGLLVARPEIQTPPDGQPIFGTWPDNAWSIQRLSTESSDGRAMDEELFFRLMRLRGNRRWVPQMYDGGQKVPDEGEDFFVGGRGGLLVVRHGITRVAGRADDPSGYDTAGVIIGAFESARGSTFTANAVGVEDAVFVSRACAPDDSTCDPVRSKLPLGDRWAFHASVPRAKYSISALGTATEPGKDKRNFLLSFGSETWKLEALDGTPAGMWPAKDGGLWLLIDANLLHRSGAGVWESVALPEGLGSVTAGMRNDASELWVAGVRDGTPRLYAVAGTPTPPPAAE